MSVPPSYYARNGKREVDRLTASSCSLKRMSIPAFAPNKAYPTSGLFIMCAVILLAVSPSIHLGCELGGAWEGEKRVSVTGASHPRCFARGVGAGDLRSSRWRSGAASQSLADKVGNGER